MMTVEREGAAAVAQEMLSRLLGRHTQAHRPDVIARVRALMAGASAGAILTALRAMMTRADSSTDLAAFTGPVLLVRGEQDELTTPADIARMCEAHPGAARAEIPAAGHLPNLEQADAFNQTLVDFLVQRAAA